MKLILTAILTLCLALTTKAQIKESITKPGWTKAQADLKKYNSKLLKQIEEYGFNSTSSFEIKIKHPDKKDKGAIKQYSRSAYSCYANIYNKYEDIWPEDWILYPFKIITPKNKEGEKYEFTAYVRYSRSEFVGKNGCYGTLKDSYSFHAITVRLDKVEGNELTHSQMLNLYLDKLDKDKIGKYSSHIENTGLKGVVSIDSIVFEPKEGSSRTPELKEYRVFMYNKVAEYDGFIPVKFYQQKKTARCWFKVKKGSPVVIEKFFYVGDIVETQQFSIEDMPSYEIMTTNKEHKSRDYYQNTVIEKTPQLCKLGLLNIYSYLEEALNSKSLNEIKQDELLAALFDAEGGKEALISLHGLYSELKNGLWTIEKQEVKYRTWALQGYQQGFIDIKQHVDRNLSKEQIASIKGKVSKESYKHAKTHTGGTNSIIIKLKLVDGQPKIYKAENYSYNKPRN